MPTFDDDQDPSPRDDDAHGQPGRDDRPGDDEPIRHPRDGDAPERTPFDTRDPDQRTLGFRADPSPSEIDPIMDEEDFEDEPEQQEMGFFDHLEELRWRVIKSLIALTVMAILCAVFLKEIVEKILLGPGNRLTPPLDLQNTEPMGQVTLAIQVALISGLILSIPFILWQFWGFIKPGLYEKERNMAGGISVATIVCFLIGVAFAYFVMIPASLSFTNSFQFQGVANRFTISNYFSFILGFILACGVVFEMPMLSYALSRFGIINPGMLRKYRRHAIVVILIAAAIITPTPDPFNQLLLAVPLYALFEISILVAVLGKRQRAESMEKMEDLEQLE